MANQFNEISPLDGTPAFAITRVARLLRFDLWKMLGDTGTQLTPEQYFMLHRLHHGDGRSQIELADRVLLDRPNVTRLIDALEKKKLVRRATDASDRRKTLVHITTEGRRLVRKLKRTVTVTRARKRAFAGMSQKELNQLGTLLGRIENNLSQK